jgi:predicted  nucleic acid-binding Zn-ribbon protein
MDDPELFPDQPEPEEHAKQHEPEQQSKDVSKSVTQLGSRLRVLEEQYTNLRNKSQLTDNNLLDFEQDLRQDVKSLNQDVVDLKHEVNELKDKLKVLDDQLGNAVQEHEFNVLERYVDLWDPTRFVTRNELKSFKEQYLDEDE